MSGHSRGRERGREGASVRREGEQNSEETRRQSGGHSRRGTATRPKPKHREKMETMRGEERKEEEKRKGGRKEERKSALERQRESERQASESIRERGEVQPIRDEMELLESERRILSPGCCTEEREKKGGREKERGRREGEN